MQRRKSPSLTAKTTSTIVLKQEAACVTQPWLFTCAGVKENIVHWPYVQLVTPSREPIGKAVSSTVCSQNPEADLTDDRLWQLERKLNSKHVRWTCWWLLGRGEWNSHWVSGWAQKWYTAKLALVGINPNQILFSFSAQVIKLKLERHGEWERRKARPTLPCTF